MNQELRGGRLRRTADPVVDTSRFLSRVLRHRPDSIGVSLDPAGWIDISTLLAAAASHGRPISEDLLETVVRTNDKRRFEVDGRRIRAAQGHSVAVDLDLPAVRPPDVLYHGTVARFLDSIFVDGLRPGRRTHVHLSIDVVTAVTVGARRGQPVVLRVDAAGMHTAGHVFFRSANGVWLTAHVPASWLSRASATPPG